MASDPEHSVWMGLEYFCNEGDRMWQMNDDRFAAAAIREMVRAAANAFFLRSSSLFFRLLFICLSS